MFYKKKILVTGGAGSMGREIVVELLKYDPAVIRILDASENSLFNRKESNEKYGNVRYLLGDIRNKERLSLAMEDMDLVFHTAALKHVEICEYNPFEALRTNVLGTQNVIEAARENNVDKVIFTSSDKAVNPANTMGTTKLLAEKLIITANHYRGPKRRTKFFCVRFGNILGTSGSILPLLKKQIENGGPVTITDEKMTRFVLTRSHAINFLFKSIMTTEGGEIFVPKMPVVRITDFVDVLLEVYPKKCNLSQRDIEIKQIGIKSGEKLYEELMTEEETSRCLKIDDIYIILPQLKELSPVDTSSYKGSKKMYPAELTSRNIKPLNKEKIKAMLRKEGLI